MSEESHMTYKEVVDGLRQQLAAANVKVEKLRDALERIKGINQDCFRTAGTWLPSQSMVVEIAVKALADEDIIL